MIKRIIGAIFAVCVLVLLVFVALGHGSYRSLLPEGVFGGATEASVSADGDGGAEKADGAGRSADTEKTGGGKKETGAAKGSSERK